MKIMIAAVLALSVLAGLAAPASAGGGRHAKFNATKFFADLDRWGGGAEGGGV